MYNSTLLPRPKNEVYVEVGRDNGPFVGYLCCGASRKNVSGDYRHTHPDEVIAFAYNSPCSSVGRRREDGPVTIQEGGQLSMR